MSLVYSTDEGTAVGTKRHRLYLGSKSDAKALDELKRWGVTHILNVTPEKEAGVKSGVANFFETRFTYKRIPVYDASTSDLLSYANTVVGFISSGLCHGSVLVHCKRGQSRSVTCIVFYLMRKVGMTLGEAMETVRKARPEIDPIPAFMSQLETYEQQCYDLGVIRSSKTEKRKLSTTDSSSSKKRIVGPTMRPVTVSQSAPTDSSIASLGPNGPAATRDTESETSASTAIEGERKALPNIGPSVLPSQAQQPQRPRIGPQLASDTEKSIDNGSANYPRNENEKDAPIGPSLPPSATTEQNKETPKRRTQIIGPSLPPKGNR